MLGKIRIETGNSLVAKDWKVYLDDKDISNFVRSIHIFAEAAQGTEVYLTLIGNLELPNELMALVSADIEEEE